MTTENDRYYPTMNLRFIKRRVAGDDSKWEATFLQQEFYRVLDSGHERIWRDVPLEGWGDL